MKRLSRNKKRPERELEVLPGQDDSGSSGEPEASNVAVKKAQRLEEYGLFILHDLPRDQINALDIVAVHGLSGNWRKTWTSRQSGKNWLQDFLPSQLKSQRLESRVMSYGYSSGGILSKSVSDIDDVARELLTRLHGQRRTTAERARPILFIAHSLGGVVVKQTMIVAHERSNIFGDLHDKVVAFVFLGVPHRGSDLAFWHKLVIELSKFAQLDLRGNPNFAAVLETNSARLADISSQSVERLQSPIIDIDIRTFYESDKFQNILIVDKSSAVLNVRNERAMQISATNHKTICKFPAEDSQTYIPVFDAISQIAEKALVKHNATLTGEAAGTPVQGLLSTTDRWEALFAGRTQTVRGYKNLRIPQIGSDIKTFEFSEPYLEPPRVLIGISHLDVDFRQVLRARASVSEVTPRSFRPVLETWAATECYGISGSWLEIAPGDSDVQRGRCNTYGLDKAFTEGTCMKIIRDVDFYNPYAEVPEVICYLVHIDSSQFKNHRMHVSPQNITRTGFEIHLDSWGDSQIYELEAEWIAFSKNRKDIHAFPEEAVMLTASSWEDSVSLSGKKFRESTIVFRRVFSPGYYIRKECEGQGIGAGRE